ncbi:MAG TPA: cell division protein ZapE [Hypericibacter adhaerens]|jgi:cell division protein ZapE|uniref:Cell division protein ZapE n=1 Tax=Hypericibacter adhaerens TaxID=2602016 RepID=A0A5J6N5R7_9PROT|nr:cell division protein ZapE [Hypericibacter adhaerens]QEX24767.1 cell division protein ZapE [Hypericibacter adhaerens]HWA45374.1 cell division protein ZapE [Hypericibacter adhaerens]
MTPVADSIETGPSGRPATPSDADGAGDRGPMARYRALVASGAIAADPVQAMAAEKLQLLYHALLHYRPNGGGSRNWRERLGLVRRAQEPAPQGLYIFGPVGRGKSMLMDLFFASAPVEAKRRVHFHEFMLEIHQAMHEWRQSNEGDPIPALAARVAQSSWLLCFDEFQVTNIADAMLLGRLFEALFQKGVVVVATSNTAPADLYRGGLQRDRFLPFIALITEQLDLIELDGPTDYRLLRMKGRPLYFHPLDAASAAKLDEVWSLLTDGAKGEPASFAVQGRQLEITRAAKGTAFMSFADLCGRPLGAADYLTLATHFHSLLLSGVPRFTPERRNEGKRFITLVDELYEHRSLLAMTMEAPIELLAASDDIEFEYRRTHSRLVEMQSDEYRERHHLT